MVPRKAAPHSPFALALGCIAGLAGVMGACTRVPLVAPSGTVMNLISTTNVLPVNGSTDIIAILIRNGTPTTPSTGTPGTPAATPSASNGSTGTPVHDGTVVDFTTTLGYLQPAETTTSAGAATVKLVADGRSGVATVTAYSGGASKTVTVNIGAAAATRIVVTAQPQALPATGGTTTITANVQDQQGNPIGSVPVAFSTDAGSLTATNVVTDNFGNAMTMLTTNATATVTATTGGGTGGTGGNAPTPGTVKVTVRPAATITITPPTSATVSSPASFTIAVGTAVIATDVTIDFGDGSKPQDLGPVSGSVTVQHTYGRAASYTVTVTGQFADGTTSSWNTVVAVVSFTATLTCPVSPSTVNASSFFLLTLNPSNVGISSVDWHFDSDEGGTQSGASTSTQHVWRTQGLHTVTATVNPTSGPATNAGGCQIFVNAAPPTVPTFPPARGR